MINKIPKLTFGIFLYKWLVDLESQVEKLYTF
ncbi:hypothetical protein QE422_002596 [Chryseobacterium sp. SORGH_AS 447]|nr:hypothetical protein [Chryseobacterium sp. SORGH_AS_0447]